MFQIADILTETDTHTFNCANQLELLLPQIVDLLEKFLDQKQRQTLTHRTLN